MAHLVLITSVLRPRNAASLFSADDRFVQLLESIASVRSKIPDHHIVVLEGSPYTAAQRRAVAEAGAADVFPVNVDALDKQHGEAALLLQYLRSDHFLRLASSRQILSVHKLSGRYVLLPQFVFRYDGERCVCSFHPPETSYSGQGYINTRYYALPFQYVDNFRRALDMCSKQMFVNIEHSFFRYEAFPLDKIDRSVSKLHVGGYLAPDGVYVED